MTTAEDTSHFNCRTWENNSRAEMKAPSLLVSSCMSRCQHELFSGTIGTNSPA